jgi:HPt (histidine-containing phosphotransfer) domain-containing protein
MPEYKHINTSVLNEVASGSRELLGDLVKMFANQVPIFTQQLEVLKQNKDYSSLSKLAHKIKGSVSTLGITDLSIKMKELENEATIGLNTKKINELIESFKVTSDKAILELNDLLNKT